MLIHGEGRVLVLDDQASIRQLVSDLLGRLGYESKGVADGREALDAYGRVRTEGKGFDAVIMDLTVPGGMGGREVASRILELDPEALTVVSSGYSDDPIMAEYRDHGFMGVVAKPYNIGELSRVLAQLAWGPSKDSDPTLQFAVDASPSRRFRSIVFK